MSKEMEELKRLKERVLVLKESETKKMKLVSKLREILEGRKAELDRLLEVISKRDQRIEDLLRERVRLKDELVGLRSLAEFHEDHCRIEDCEEPDCEYCDV